MVTGFTLTSVALDVTPFKVLPPVTVKKPRLGLKLNDLAPQYAAIPFVVARESGNGVDCVIAEAPTVIVMAFTV